MHHSMEYQRARSPGEGGSFVLSGTGSVLVGEAAKSELENMGLSVEGIHASLIRGYVTARDMTGGNWPRTAGPFVAWAATNKFMRDRYVPEGWAAHEDAGVVLTCSPTRGFVVTAARGNENTGLPHRIPSTWRPRGRAGACRVLDNRQGDLFPEELPPPPKTWYVLYHLHVAPEQREMRAEVSLPSQLDETGHVRGWYKRILLPKIDLTRKTT